MVCLNSNHVQTTKVENTLFYFKTILLNISKNLFIPQNFCSTDGPNLRHSSCSYSLKMTNVMVETSGFWLKCILWHCLLYFFNFVFHLSVLACYFRSKRKEVIGECFYLEKFENVKYLKKTEVTFQGVMLLLEFYD